MNAFLPPPPEKELLARLHAARAQAEKELLAERTAAGHWEGELSSSALSTATAVCALAITARERRTSGALAGDLAALIGHGLEWLARHANSDGGWGDTTASFSNISTTALCWAAFGVVSGADERYRSTVIAAEEWLARHAGGIDPETLSSAIVRRYGKDRTFSVPILTMCALAGRLGQGREAWRLVLPLPFELAACPPEWFAALKLPVVSYALPALIAIGHVRHFHLPTLNSFSRIARDLTRLKTLDVLASIQPVSGGFLEATPLTSFVTMSLAASGQADHVVTRKGVEFLLNSVRADGSWAIDTNLATWVTTLTINALGCEGTGGGAKPSNPAAWNRQARERVRGWLLGQQYREKHPYTQAAPGGWAWTDLSGGVPDADDTAGALLALRHLEVETPGNHSTQEAVDAGTTWLLNLQNDDGGIPTFCRGWGTLPFDRSSPDLTAHALRAWMAWKLELPAILQERVEAAIAAAIDYLRSTQKKSGAWEPLWFGNQHAIDDENPTYGTARVLTALAVLMPGYREKVEPLLCRGVGWLRSAQNADGSWGGIAGGNPSVEETALAVEAIATVVEIYRNEEKGGDIEAWSSALLKGTKWLMAKVASDGWKTPSPIGFYFAKLWYYERLYPMIFTVGALNRAVSALG